MELTAGDYRLVVAPERGGSILEFEWRGEPLLRPAYGDTILDVACYPLVPFCNRIAKGQFEWNDRDIQLAPNYPIADPHNVIHGYGWISAWAVTSCERSQLTLAHRHEGGDWLWPYVAELSYGLSGEGLSIDLTLSNLSDEPMPAGFGLHPFFPRDARTLYQGHHRGEWQTGPDCLPRTLNWQPEAFDWWHGMPVSSRTVDTVYTERVGALQIDWPERDLRLVMTPSANLSHTAVYAPPDADWFCVEPMSHMTNALNHGPQESTMKALGAQDTMSCSLRISAKRSARQ
jgi:aldose 1-epimerase